MLQQKVHTLHFACYLYTKTWVLSHSFQGHLSHSCGDSMVVCVYRYMTAENPYISLTAECLCVGGGGERREKVYVFITYLRAETPVFIYI